MSRPITNDDLAGLAAVPVVYPLMLATYAAPLAVVIASKAAEICPVARLARSFLRGLEGW